MSGEVRVGGAFGLVVAAVLAGCQPQTLVTEKPSPVELPVKALQALSCDLTAHHSAGVSRTYEPEPGGGRLTLTFQNLDRDRGTAKAIGNQAAMDVSYEVASFAGNPQAIFIERTFSGSVNVTSVFFASAPPGEPFDDRNPTVRGPLATAVHSRHILVGAHNDVPTASVSQYVGTCQLK
jgi:hypothetical protein